MTAISLNATRFFDECILKYSFISLKVMLKMSSNEIEPSCTFIEYYSNLLSYTSWILKKIFASAPSPLSRIAALLSLSY